MDLSNYTADDLRQLLQLARSLRLAAMLDLQKRFLADLESFVTSEIGRRAQHAARLAG